MLAEESLLERDIERRNASEGQDREVRRQGKRTRFTQGQLFDRLYNGKHAEELAEQWEAEETRKGASRTEAHAVRHAELSNLAQRRVEAIPTEGESIA